MTARHQLRIGNRRLGRDRAAIDATPAPRVGESLQLARERKGVDLFRAERDTKIRLRYLSALEDGAYEDLPAAVYTKGFLRNYAIYLGLDPEELIERWRDEMESLRAVERIAVAPPPQPIAAPGRRVTIAPGMFVAGLVALVVLAFIGYIGLQLLRFVETIPVAVTDPANAVSTVDAEAYMLEGTSGPGALITIRGPGDDLYNTTANEEGEWSREVELTLGMNRFEITATDPVTQRVSDPPAVLTISVPLPSQSPGFSPSAPPPAALTLSLLGPTDGLVSTDGNVTVTGSTSAGRITIASTYLGTPAATPLPISSPGVEASPQAPAGPTPSPEPSPMPSPVALPSSGPGPSGSLAPMRDITVPDSGTFSETFSLSTGRWELTVTAHGIGVAPLSETRTVTVAPPVVSGIVLVISVENRDSWVRLVADGERQGGYGTLRVGETRTATAINELCLRTGNAGGLHLNVNGLDLGLLGRVGQVGSWIIRPGQAPEPAPVSC